MLKRTLAVGFTAGLAALILAGCGGKESATPTPVGNGALYTFVGDTPVSDVLSFRVYVTGMTLKVQGGENKVTVIPSSYIKVNFASLRDFATVLNLTSVPAGTYDEATITFSTAQLVLYDPTKSPPVTTLYAVLSTSGPTIAIRPALTIVKDQVHALRLDFDFLRSIELDADGQVTGKVTPIFKATPVLATANQGFGELDDLVGFVRTVSPYSTSTDFTGSLNLQLLAGTGPSLTVNLNNDSQLYGVPALNQLETGRVVEIDAVVDDKGNLVAKTVEVEARAVVEENKLAFLGYVTSVTKDESGKVTQFSLYVREEEPDNAYDVALDSVVVVNVTENTTFQYSARPTNFLNLPFDATAMTPGQELIVHGKYTKTTDQPTTVDADMIVLKLQTMQGGLSSLVRVGADGRTGVFSFAPGASLLQGSPVLVFTNNQTVFLNVFGLGDLRPQAILLVRGLPFYQTQATTINNVPVPAGTLVIAARQIHQLQ
jgi:hypothetical protein